MKKKSKIISVVCFAVIIIALVVFCLRSINFQSVSEHESISETTLASGVKVTVSINCSTVFDNLASLDEGLKDSGVLPEDGVILSETEITLNEDATVLDALESACALNKIQYEYNGEDYISGIGNLYERNCGSLSGWMYKVNGEFPQVSCDDYYLENGDTVEWVYTCNLGEDVGERWISEQE